MQRTITATAAVLGFTAIALGAFGAHMLRKSLDPVQLGAFETGVRYQMYHALLLLAVSLLPIGEKTRRWLYGLTLAGVILFSGSVYLLSTMPVSGVDFRSIGFVTPIGGLLLLVAWLLLFIDFTRRKS